jgi:hypothetical protein
MLPPDAFTIPLDGFALHLRPAEVESVIAGLGEVDTPPEGDALTLAEALRRMGPNDRAPTWELLIRRYARRKPLAQASGEIGMDRLHAEELLAHYTQQLSAPER